MSSKIKRFYEFEDFRLDAANTSLWRSGQTVSIPPKALDVLIVLIERRREIVSREELLDAVWKDTFVEEGNINYTVSQLRKILGNKDLVQTVPRRGYRFAGEVREITENETPPTGANAVGLPVVETPALEEAEHSATSGETRRRPRLMMFSAALVIAILLASFVYFRQNAKAARPPETLPSANPEAMQAYTRGKMILARKSAEKRTEKAIDEFQNAVTLDPTFALAYAGLAEGFTSTGVKEPFPSSSEFYIKAKVAAEKSLALDPNLAEGFMIRGWTKRLADWDWAGAETDLRRAIELNSKIAAAHQRLAHTLCSLGRLDEALSEAKIAYELDPIADYIVGARFPILEARREYAAALKEAEQFLRENKSNNAAQRAYATFLYHTGNYEKVIEVGEQALAKETPQGLFAWHSLLAAAYYKTNRFDKAEENLKRLEELAQTDTKALYSLAMNYAELDRADEALMNLERCFKEREERMVWIKVEPRFDNLRADARFEELLKKMNF